MCIYICVCDDDDDDDKKKKNNNNYYSHNDHHHKSNNHNSNNNKNENDNIYVHIYTYIHPCCIGFIMHLQKKVPHTKSADRSPPTASSRCWQLASPCPMHSDHPGESRKNPGKRWWKFVKSP